jgi:MYXO-CTERM domain-containing protein
MLATCSGRESPQGEAAGSVPKGEVVNSQEALRQESSGGPVPGLQGAALPGEVSPSRPAAQVALAAVTSLNPGIVAPASAEGPAHFVYRDGNVSAFFVDSGFALSLLEKREVESEGPERHRPRPASDEKVRGWGLHFGLVGAKAVRPRGEDVRETKVSYFLGPKERWRTGLPAYGRVVYEDVYPGIDMEVSALRHGLEYGFVVKPGAKPTAIRMQWRGATKVEVAEDGTSVLLTTGLGLLKEEKLRCYQPDGNGGEEDVPCRYVAEGGGALRLAFGRVDGARPLVIDPVIDYGSYLGGSGSDEGYGIAVDRSGNVYVTGWTDSTNFPTPGGFDTSRGGPLDAFVTDAFVTKVTAAGGLAWSSYLGGSGWEEGLGIAVDGSGNVYVTGYTSSTDFPTPGGFDTMHGGGTIFGDAFVTKVNANGQGLAWSSYLGGSGDDYGNGIAVDGSGNVYVTGSTQSTDFPTPGGFDTTYGGGISGDAFVTKVNANGQGLDWSSYLGGSGDDYGTGIAVDGSGNVYVTGGTYSTNFPTDGGFDTTRGGLQDALVTKVNANGQSLDWSSYLGGSGNDRGTGIAVDGSGDVYVTGYTQSTDFPTPGGFDTTYGGGISGDAFVTKVNANGQDLAWSSYLGGSGEDWGRGIAVDGNGNVYVTGYTKSTDFPTTQGGFDTTLGGSQDAFVTKVNANGQSLAWSSYLGGSSDDYGGGIAVHGSGNVYVTGYTRSNDFPTTPGGFDTTLDGAGEAFVVRIGRANGTNCASASECLSGHCVDGVCCDSDCGGGVTTDCQACSVDAGAAMDGACGFVSTGRTCRASAGPCDVEEKCTGNSAACPADSYEPATTVCRTATCNGDMAVEEAFCTGMSASCPPEVSKSCAPGTCVAGTCVTDGGVTDGGVMDGGVMDGGVTDGGVMDGGVMDGGVTDGGVTDGGVTDGGVTDGGVTDGGVTDGGGGTGDMSDAGMQDGQEASAIFKPGCGCSGTDGGLLWGLLALAVLAQRRASRAHRG